MKPEIAMKYNRRIFPFYKGFGWDPLFYSEIIFLFLTQVKGISPAKIMYAESIYFLFLLALQIPSVILVEKIGSKKSLILGTFLATLQIASMIFVTNFTCLIFAYFFSAFGTALKDIARNTLLFDSTKNNKGKNSFGNINAQGSSFSYALRSTTSLFTGYLFVINQYLPLILSTFISFLAIVLACRLEEVTLENKEKTTLTESIHDMKQGLGFILKSKRLKALFLFIPLFVGILMMISTYEKSLLKDLQVSPQYFGIIFAFFTLVQCFSVKFQDKIHNTYRSRTLAFLSIPVFLSFIIIGLVGYFHFNFIFTFIIIMFAFFVHHFFRGPYWVLEDRYVTNFTNANIRAKILSVNNLIKNLGEFLLSFLGGLLLEFYSTSNAYLVIGVFGLVVLLLVLIYMKKRVGLDPSMYAKEDIEFVRK